MCVRAGVFCLLLFKLSESRILYRIGLLAFLYLCINAGMLSVCYSLTMCVCVYVWALIAVLSECDSHTPRVLWGISGFRGDSSCVALCYTQI